MNYKELVSVVGSHGTLWVDPVTGNVLDRDLEPSAVDEPAYSAVRVDIEEYQKREGCALPHEDILWVGLYLPDGKYVPPEYDFISECIIRE
jgi:hypothetical protein